MNKAEFLNELKMRLELLPPDEREAAVRYYEEFFNDAGAENEQSVIQQLRSPKEVSDVILEEFAQTGQSSYNRYTPPASAAPIKKSGLPLWAAIILIIFASPFLACVLCVAVALLLAVFAVAVALIAVMVSIFAAGIAVFIAGIGTLFSSPAAGVLMMSVGLVLMGIGLLLILPVIQLCAKGLPRFVRWFVDVCKRPFRRRGAHI